jgi:hypothetical protein
MNNATRIADTILAQLGGMGVLSMMLGAKQFVALESGVQFRFAAKGLRGINTCVVKLDPSDTYTVEFWSVRGAKSRKVGESSDVYADSLRDVFEHATGLYLTFAPRRCA